MTIPDPLPGDFALVTTDKIRYSDTDRQGHVNNVVFSTFLETGRVEFLYDPTRGLPPDGAEFVIANLNLQFKAEIQWPGVVTIGTRVGRIGRTSVQLEQAVFQDERCVATAETTIVLIDRRSRRPTPFDETTVTTLEAHRQPAGGDHAW